MEGGGQGPSIRRLFEGEGEGFGTKYGGANCNFPSKVKPSAKGCDVNSHCLGKNFSMSNKLGGIGLNGNKLN